MIKAECIITSVFSVTWSSEIILICWFAAQETFLIIISVEKCAASYFCGNWCILFFRILWLIESSKEQHLIEIEIFFNIINVFTVTFDRLYFIFDYIQYISKYFTVLFFLGFLLNSWESHSLISCECIRRMFFVVFYFKPPCFFPARLFDL